MFERDFKNAVNILSGKPQKSSITRKEVVKGKETHMHTHTDEKCQALSGIIRRMNVLLREEGGSYKGPRP